MSRWISLLLALVFAPAAAASPTEAPSFVFKDLRFLPRRLEEARGQGPLVLLLIRDFDRESEACLKALEELRSSRPKTAFLVLDLDEERGIPELAARVFERDLALRFGKDRKGASARALGLDRPMRALAVLDSAGQARYRGGVDPALIKALPVFLDALAEGAALPKLPELSCSRAPKPAKRPPSRAEYHRDIAPIIRRRCRPCHRPGGSAPFALARYEQVRGMAAMIAEVVAEGRMPPWFASGGASDFQKHQGLKAEEKTALLAWLEAGAPRGPFQGEEALAPPKPAFEADLDLGTRRAVRVPADGLMPYQYVRLPHRFAEDTWVQKIAISNEQPAALHHANLFYLRPGRPFDNSQIIAGKVPGGGPLILGEGLALKIPAGALLCLQLHYQPTGRAVEDRVRVRMSFPRGRVRRRFRAAIIERKDFRIPAGAAHHRLTASLRFEEEVIVGGLFGHMHLRGKAFRFLARSGAGREELLAVPRYSFDWQMAYAFKEPRRFAAGTRIELEAFYDNSAFNPFNPEPDRPVGYGLQTGSEMLLGVVYYVRAGERLSLRIDPRSGVVLGP